MPILNQPLDPDGHALIDLRLSPAQGRRAALLVVGSSHPLELTAAGMIDTGATVTVIDPQVRQALNLTPYRIRRTSVPSARAPIRVPSYKLDLAILDNSGQAWLLHPMLSVLEMPITHTGTAVLLGCDVLSRCLYTHNGPGHAFTLAY